MGHGPTFMEQLAVGYCSVTTRRQRVRFNSDFDSPCVAWGHFALEISRDLIPRRSSGFREKESDFGASGTRREKRESKV